MSDSYPPINCRAIPAGASVAAADLTPAHLLVALPHLFGANPRGSLVLLGLTRGRLGGAAVSALRDVTSPEDVDRVVNVFTEYDDDSAIVAVVGDPVTPAHDAPVGPDGTTEHQHLADLVREALSRYRVDVVQTLQAPALAEGAPWTDLDTGATGTMPPVEPDDSTLVHRVLTGKFALPDATALHASLQTPDSDLDAADRFRSQVARTAAVRTAADEHTAMAALDRLIQPVGLAVSGHRLDTAHSPTQRSLVDDEWAARLVLALYQDSVQEHALLLTGRHPSEARRLWHELVRRTAATPDHRSLPAALLATAAYLDGDARFARVTLDIATGNPGPDDRLMATIARSLNNGIAPRRIRRLLHDRDPGHRGDNG